ncbi:peptidase inhibitor family I36 protein (plasmid) [Streptomyces sp. NBC_01450]|uniref:peptidase inhibitor family I36 protein n=1 Tax=Streptomyces sp. NBC_01450 TaxID=2903871 RepID=UPI002E2FB97F|nr:peptidase inhibitor family I36 protein [Streptomyces sp. NBC_01450]
MFKIKERALTAGIASVLLAGGAVATATPASAATCPQGQACVYTDANLTGSSTTLYMVQSGYPMPAGFDNNVSSVTNNTNRALIFVDRLCTTSDSVRVCKASGVTGFGVARVGLR